MAADLISTITQALTPDTLKRIAATLSIDKVPLEKAVSVGIPALLAAFSSRAATPEGAASLSDAVAKQQPGALPNLVGGSSPAALIDSGRNALNSLLGGSSTNALSAAIDKFAGVGSAGAKAVLGLLGPVVMSALGQQQKSTGQSVSQLLAAQKDNILRALPSGFAKNLGGTGILDGVMDHAGNMAQAGAGSGYGRTSPATYASKPQGSGAGWLLPAIALLALCGLAWYVLSSLSNQRTAAIDSTPPVTTAQAPSAGGVTAPGLAAFDQLKGVKLGDVDVGTQLANAVGGLRTSLDRVTDEASARAAIPALTEAGNEFDKLSGLTDQLPADAQKTVASAITAAQPTLSQMFNRVLAIPGVGDIVKPVVDQIRSKLDAMGTA